MLNRAVVLTALLALLASPVAGQGSASPFDSLKARALLGSNLPCLGCHTYQGTGGRVGPDLTTVRDRRTTQYIAAMIDDPQRAVPGSAMPRTVMSESTRELLIRVLARSQDVPLASAPSSAASAPGPVAGTPPASGKALFARWCASCHGTSGGGDGTNARWLPVRPAALRDAAFLGRRSDDQLFDAIAAGGAPMGRSARMPAFGATLAASEVRTLISHLRVLCRCSQPAWAAAP